jgi:hypothetical protein
MGEKFTVVRADVAQPIMALNELSRASLAPRRREVH